MCCLVNLVEDADEGCDSNAAVVVFHGTCDEVVDENFSTPHLINELLLRHIMLLGV